MGLVYTAVAVEGPHGQRRCSAEEWNGNADAGASGEKAPWQEATKELYLSLATRLTSPSLDADSSALLAWSHHVVSSAWPWRPSSCHAHRSILLFLFLLTDEGLPLEVLLLAGVGVLINAAVSEVSSVSDCVTSSDFTSSDVVDVSINVNTNINIKPRAIALWYLWLSRWSQIFRKTSEFLWVLSRGWLTILPARTNPSMPLQCWAGQTFLFTPAQFFSLPAYSSVIIINQPD